MKHNNWLHTSIRFVVMIQFLFSLVFPAGALAAGNFASQPQGQAESQPANSQAGLPGISNGTTPLAPSAAALSVQILSSPTPTVDSNNGAVQPRVFVVEARVTNTGDAPAEDVTLTLNYNNTATGWILLSGEDASRQVGTLAPGASYHGYWFATYPQNVGSSYTYNVVATASNIGAPVSASTTATAISVISAANSGITQVAFNVTVGVEFDVNILYKLSNNARTANFSPVGNLDFKPGAYRLLSSTIKLYDGNNALVATYPDRVYLAQGEIPAGAVNASAEFKFIALQAENTRLCSYATVGYNSGYKYDINYCNPASGGVININGSISLDFKKVADRLTVEQGELIAYTLYYTNTGQLPLKYVWLWDSYNPSLVAANSYVPAPKAPETIDGRAAWFIGDVPVGGKGSVMFDVLVDGNGADIPDGTLIVNNGYFGVTPGELPAAPALTDIVTTTVHAPAFTFTKSDGLANIVAGQAGTYTITLTNNGHTNAHTATLVDTLPAWVTAGTATPPADEVNGQVLTWNLGPIAPAQTRTIQIPYTVVTTAPNGTVLNNQATFDYSNPAGHHFTQMQRSDATTVQNAVMSITKTDSPDPVLANHELVYTLTYQNSGPAAATNVVIRDTLPEDTQFFSCTGGCYLDNGQYRWDIGTVAANSSGSVTFTVTVDDVPKDTIITNDGYSLTSDQSGTITGPAATTTTQREAAIFNVRAYVDENGNGQYDLGEALIQGVEITAPESITPTQTTDANGYVKVRVETSGLVTISASEPSGYIHATPDHLTTQAVLGTTTDIDFGYITETTGFAIVFGTVYEDANHNGVYDPGEMGIPGATVSSPQAVAPGSVTTGPFGWYTLKFTTPGTATINETDAAGYVSTTPDTLIAPIIIPSNNSSPYDFGDFAGVKITGKVFDDINANGADDGEDGLAGIAVSAGLESTLTDAEGLFTLYVAVPPTDPITIRETHPAGYASTNAIPGTAGVVKVDNDTLYIAAPVAGTYYTGNAFGDAGLEEIVTVTGYVWEDNGAGPGGIPANGLREAGEPGLAGAKLSLSSGLSTTSAADGSFTLYGPANTALTLSEENPGTYLSTNAIPGLGASKVDNDTLLIAPQAPAFISSGHLFGDVLPAPVAVVSGYVFDDANENGLKDGEDGIPGIPVTLEFEDGHTIVIPTEADGSYQFAVNPGENLLVRTDGPAHPFYPTTPTSYFFTVPAVGTYPDVNFGFSDDTNAAVITGVVYDDLNSNGERDFGEPGLGGARVILDLPTNFRDTLGTGITAGAYSFNITSAAGLHKVEQTIHPAGYRSTTPDLMNIFVVPGNSYIVDFGDTNNPEHASIYGVVFDDFNQNGLRDIGEPGLAGVAITITTGTGDISMLTKSYGQFSYGFEVLGQGNHTVFSQDPAKPNYHSTTPDFVNLFVELNNSYQIDFGDAMNDSTAMILGTVFQDDNGDGNQDPSELGLSGVTVNLTGHAPATTNAYGWYSFLVSTQGLYQVTETDPANYYSTTPNQVAVNVNEWKNYEVNFGDLNNPNATAFHGTVFEDLNVNGARDANELGIPGVTVTLENGITTPYVTNAWGQYTFLLDEVGAYTITETDLGGYGSTDAIPGSAKVIRIDANTLSTVIAEEDFGQELADNLFGDVRTSAAAAISGMVWNDLNADGIKDDGEPGLAGATVSLSSGTWMVTADDGLYLLYAPANTAVDLSEDNPTGYFSTNALPGANNTKLTNDIIQVAAVAAGGTSTGNNFGDTLLEGKAVIFGYVFEDKNFNGLFDGTDAGLSGVTLTLDGSTTTTSLSDGYYQFVLTEAGTYVVEESDPSGYFSITPNAVHVEVELGNDYQVNFADAKTNASFAVINGTVFNDLDGDGLFDAGEAGLPGVSVKLDGATTKTTGSFGSYFFIVDTTGLHTVEQTNLPDYISTTPDYLVLDVTALAETYVADFGDVLKGSADNFAVIYGTVFNDLNGNGLREANEPGMAGVTVTLDGTTPAVTNALGVYSFKVTTTGVHSVVETNPANFFSTTPDTVHVNVAFGNTYRVDFGNAANNSGFGVIYGIVFDDLNFDAVWDGNEPGIPGVTITLDNNAATTTTNDFGVFFFGVTAGPHQVSETDPDGYLSSTPNLVNVEVLNGQGKLVLFGDFVPCTIVKDDKEENDTLETAKPIAGFGSTNTYNFADDAHDWFTFQAQVHGTYTITVKATGQRTDSVITVYGKDKVTVMATNDDVENTDDFSSEVTFEAPMSGTYYIHVTNRNSLQGCRTDYELTVEETPSPIKYLYLPLILKEEAPLAPASALSLPAAPTVATDLLSPNAPETPDGVIQHICQDAFELDDTWENANEIQNGDIQLHSFDSNTALYAADKDHVWFSAALLDQVSFTITIPAGSAAAAVMELYDSERNLIKTGTSTLTWTVSKDGNYYLIISPTSDAFGCADVAGYNLAMTKAPAKMLYLPLILK